MSLFSQVLDAIHDGMKITFTPDNVAPGTSLSVLCLSVTTNKIGNPYRLSGNREPGNVHGVSRFMIYQPLTGKQM